MGIISLKYDLSFKHLMLNEEVRKYFVSDVLGIPAKKMSLIRNLRVLYEDISTLNGWLKLAVKAENLGEFREKAGL